MVISSAENIPLFFRNLIAEFDKNKQNFTNKSKFRFPEIFLSIPRNLLQQSPESSRTFPGIFLYILPNLFKHSPESLQTFPGILLNIPRNPSKHSPRSLHSLYTLPRSCIPGFINSRILIIAF